MDCTGLKKVTFGKELQTISDNCLADCTALKSVTLPEKLLHIGANAFRDFTALRTLELSNGIVNIGKGAFVYGADRFGMSTAGNLRYHTAVTVVNIDLAQYDV